MHELRSSKVYEENYNLNRSEKKARNPRILRAWERN
jgi:hypothetical protein